MKQLCGSLRYKCNCQRRTAPNLTCFASVWLELACGSVIPTPPTSGLTRTMRLGMENRSMLSALDNR